MIEHTVDQLYVGQEFVTNVWISQKAKQELQKMRRFPDLGKLVDKIRYWAVSGFEKWEGATRPIVPEWDGVFSLRYQSLHRILGFYENDDRTRFIVIDVFLKKDRGLNEAESGRIDRVGQVKKLNLWVRGQ